MAKQKRRSNRRKKRGFTLIDVIISLSIVTMMVLVYAGLATVRNLNRNTSFRAQAAALADEEIGALKRLGVSAITTQTSGSFMNILYNAGSWGITTDSGNLDAVSSPCPPPTSGLHCGANVLELAKNSISNTSGRLLLPAGAYSDATLQASWKVMSDSASGWAVGYFFRAADSSNTYRLRVAGAGTDLDSTTSGTQNFVLDKLVGGTNTVIFSKSSVTFNANTWYSLKVVFSGSSIKMYLNGNEQDSGTVSDTSFTTGSAALLGWGGVHAEVDDVQTVTTVSKSWDFEGSTSLPTAWIRLSLNDLPDTTPNTIDDNGLLTTAAYPNTNSTTLKQATVTVQWRQGAKTQSYTAYGLIGNSTLGK